MKIIGYAGAGQKIVPANITHAKSSNKNSEKREKRESREKIFPAKISVHFARTVSAVVLVGFFAFAMVFSPTVGTGDIKTDTNSVAVSGIGPFDAAPAAAVAGGSLQKLVVLDAGHGGMDGGATGGTVSGESGVVLEKDINLAIVKDLEAMLKFAGYTVVLTRDSDISIHDKNVSGVRNQKVSDMKNRKAIIDANAEGIFISVHQNQFTDPRYFGAQMFYLNENPLNTQLAQLAQESFRELQPDNNREIAESDGMFLLKGTKQPAILAECGFISNASDAANLTDRDYQKKVAFTLLRTVDEFYARQYGLLREENIAEDNYIS